MKFITNSKKTLIIGSHRTQLRFSYLELVHLGLVWFITKSGIDKVALRPATLSNQEWKVKLKPGTIDDVGLDVTTISSKEGFGIA